MKNKKELDSILRRMSARTGDKRRIKLIAKLLIEEIEELYEIVGKLGYVDPGYPTKEEKTNWMPKNIIPENIGTPLTDIINNLETEEGTTDEGAEDPEPTLEEIEAETAREEIHRLVRNVADKPDPSEDADDLSEDELFDVLDRKEDSEDDPETPAPDED